MLRSGVDVKVTDQRVAVVDGSPNPDLAMQLVAVCFEGLFLHSIGGRANIGSRDLIKAIVQAAM